MKGKQMFQIFRQNGREGEGAAHSAPPALYTYGSEQQLQTVMPYSLIYPQSRKSGFNQFPLTSKVQYDINEF